MNQHTNSSLSIDQCLHCTLSIDQCLHCPLINAFIVHWSMPSFSIDQCLHCLLINAFIVYWSIPSLSTDQCLHCLLINASLCIDKALARSCAVKCDIQQEQCWVPHQILNATQSIVLHLSAPHTVAYPHPPTSQFLWLVLTLFNWDATCLISHPAVHKCLPPWFGPEIAVIKQDRGEKFEGAAKEGGWISQNEPFIWIEMCVESA